MPSFEEILNFCQQDPEYFYKSELKNCVCGCTVRNNHSSIIPTLTFSQIKFLIKKNYIVCSKVFPGETFHDWCVKANSLNWQTGEVIYTASHLVDVLLLFVENSNMIINHRYIFDEDDVLNPSSVISSFYSCSVYAREYWHKLFYTFQLNGFDFSKEYWTLWCSVKFQDTSVTNFLLTNGMKMEDCIIKTKYGEITDNIKESCIGESLEEIFNEKLLDKKSEFYSREIFRSTFILCNELVARGFPKDVINVYYSNTANPFFKW